MLKQINDTLDECIEDMAMHIEEMESMNKDAPVSTTQLDHMVVYALNS